MLGSEHYVGIGNLKVVRYRLQEVGIRGINGKVCRCKFGDFLGGFLCLQ